MLSSDKDNTSCMKMLSLCVILCASVKSTPKVGVKAISVNECLQVFTCVWVQETEGDGERLVLKNISKYGTSSDQRTAVVKQGEKQSGELFLHNTTPQFFAFLLTVIFLSFEIGCSPLLAKCHTRLCLKIYPLSLFWLCRHVVFEKGATLLPI